MEIRIKRVYEEPSDGDGLRILVDRSWPRGIKKAELPFDIWLKTVSPSDEIKKLFHQDPDGYWSSFHDKYKEELRQSPAFNDFIAQLQKANPSVVTLLFAFRNKLKNHALVLKEAIEERIND